MMSLRGDAYVEEGLPAPDMMPSLGYFGCSPSTYPADMNCVTELLDRAVEEGYGERRALCWADGSFTYAQVAREVSRLANVLALDHGVRPGERVLLRGPNHPMLAIAWLATLKIGAVAVTTVPMLKARELIEIIDTARVNVAICDARFDAELHNAVTRAAHKPRACLIYGSQAAGALERKMESAPGECAAFRAGPEHPAIIAFTSGTTGRAKAAVHLHRDMLVVADVVSRHLLNPTPTDVFASTAPLGFTYGLGALLLFPLRARACAVYTEKPAVDELLSVLEGQGVTILFTAPTMYRRLLPFVSARSSLALRAYVSAGEHLPRAVFDAWQQATGMQIIDGIGSTEMLHIFLSASPDRIRPGATGMPLPGYEARVVDAGGNELPPGAAGLLAVRGPTGCRYLCNPERQSDYVRHGWNLTGDIFMKDEDGYFWFRSRADDMIISGGHNISGAEIENVLLASPQVEECAVVGVPDAERGHLVKAFIVPANPGEVDNEARARIEAHLAAELAVYKRPRTIEFVSALPRTTTGKVQRGKFRVAPLKGMLMTPDVLTVRNVVAAAIDRKAEEIGVSDSLPDDHGVDSLMGLEILVALQKAFKVKIPESMLMEMTSVEKITGILARNMQERELVGLGA